MLRKQLSIIIPTLNEEGNIYTLFERIDLTMLTHKIDYELVFIDDHSTDNTVKTIKSLGQKYPIRVFLKSGTKGKAQSLLEGFSFANADIVCMIDADLQYPPEAIPQMFENVAAGDADIVVADRKEFEKFSIRTVLSRIYVAFFVSFLHKINVDAQSGLKVFRKDILDKVHINPTPWAFDLEFLVQARNAGFRIASQDIVFSTRYAGQAKSRIWQTGQELALSSLRLKFKKPEIFFFDRRQLRDRGLGFYYKGLEFVHHTKLQLQETALTRFDGRQIQFLILLALVYLGALLLNWHLTLLVTLGLVTFLYFADSLFNLFLIYRSFKHTPEIKIKEKEITAQSDSSWPTYTIFCPMYKEWQVIPQFVRAMSQLDYPEDKLQVMLLLEEDDEESRAKVAEFDLPSSFEVVIVPHSMPKTKPKALNYGLLKAKGEFVVIYDAEDVPEPQQLKKAVLAFNKLPRQTICVQAKLNFYNPHQNILTRVFTAEYSLWFDLVLPGMQSISGPIPLGGTSNHFRKVDVLDLKGWDAFNVTEDCDLGIRLAKNGYTTAMIESTTWEEANSKFWNWYNQRSRWIKGYIQTYLVHMRHPKEFIEKSKRSHLLAFQFIVGGKVLSMFINPLMWAIAISYFAFRPLIGSFVDSFFPNIILYPAVMSFIFGNFLYLYNYMIGCAKRGYFDLIKYVFLVPFYWLMMSLASWKALYEIVFNPHYWSKTLHGLHLQNDRGSEQARLLVGREVIDAA